jgi:hypothetical protein
MAKFEFRFSQQVTFSGGPTAFGTHRKLACFFGNECISKSKWGNSFVYIEDKTCIGKRGCVKRDFEFRMTVYVGEEGGESLFDSTKEMASPLVGPPKFAVGIGRFTFVGSKKIHCLNA